MKAPGDPLRLAELVCARFSHDLSGLMGSLSGVLELVAEAPGAASEEIGLAGETVAALMDRLRLLRAAWSGVAMPMDEAELRALARGVVGGHRLQIDLDGLPAKPVFPAPMARLVLNVLLLAGEALPRGGVLALSGDPASHIVARVAGTGAAWPAGFALCIVDEAHAWEALDGPRTLQAPLTALVARSIGMRLSLLIAAGPTPDGGPPPLLLAPLPN